MLSTAIMERGTETRQRFNFCPLDAAPTLGVGCDRPRAARRRRRPRARVLLRGNRTHRQAVAHGAIADEHGRAHPTAVHGAETFSCALTANNVLRVDDGRGHKRERENTQIVGFATTKHWWVWRRLGWVGTDLTSTAWATVRAHAERRQTARSLTRKQ